MTVEKARNVIIQTERKRTLRRLAAEPTGNGTWRVHEITEGGWVVEVHRLSAPDVDQALSEVEQRITRRERVRDAEEIDR